MTVKEFNQRVKYRKGYDRIFGHWVIIDLHEIPKQLEKRHEIDFYCSNGQHVYLLRLRNRTLKNYTVVRDHTTYLIAEQKIKSINDQLLEAILTEFEQDYLHEK